MDDIIEMAYLLGDHRPEVKRLIGTAHRNPAMVDFVRHRLEIMLQREGHDVINPSPFAPYPDPSDLKIPGIYIGKVHQTGDELFLSREELERGVLILGSHGSGKTNFAYQLIERLMK